MSALILRLQVKWRRGRKLPGRPRCSVVHLETRRLPPPIKPHIWRFMGLVCDAQQLSAADIDSLSDLLEARLRALTPPGGAAAVKRAGTSR